MNFVLLLMVNIVAIPMTIIGGKAARRFGTKEVLTGALIVYCIVAILAVGFAPLDLDDDHDRYDFKYDWDDSDSTYKLTTLYDRGVDAWVSDRGKGMLNSETLSWNSYKMIQVTSGHRSL